MEELVNKKCLIDSSELYTITENRYDQDLVKQGYYYLLALPYKEVQIKPVPEGATTIQSEFIQEATNLVTKTQKKQNVNATNYVVEQTMKFAEKFSKNRELNNDDVQQVFKMLSTKNSEGKWMKKTLRIFEYYCFLSMVSECLVSGQDIEEVKAKYEDMQEWLQDIFSVLFEPEFKDDDVESNLEEIFRQELTLA